jgi:diguanylate cyclase (GGDEF)-like protein
MRASLILTIVAMGALGLSLEFLGSAVYREQAIENQRSMLSDHLRLEMNELRSNFEAQVHSLALHARNEPALLGAANPKQIGRLLDRLHRHAVETRAKIQVVKIYAHDADLKLLAVSSLGSPEIDSGESSCRQFLDLAARHKGSNRQKALSGVCMVDRKPYFAAMESLGDQDSSGYLFVLADMLNAMADLEAVMAIPLRLGFTDGNPLYQSPNWPAAAESEHSLVVSHTLHAYAPANSRLEVSVVKDMRGFHDGLRRTQHWVTAIAVAATLLFAFIALALLQRTAINPLRALAAQLQRVRQDKSQLGQRVAVGGNAEVVELGSGFNEMTTRLKELYESLERMAFTDPLTKLPNRTLFHDRLQQTILNAKREHKPFALCIMDLDRFKDINDTLGHHVGDMLLQQVATRLRGKLRESDTVARMGGDEFAVLLPTVSGKHAGMAARMLLQALRTPFAVEEHSLTIGASIGIALYPDHGVDANILMQRADVAMYAAKNAGSGYAYYESRLDRNNPARLALMSELRQAVEQEQFELYYQPKVSLKTGRAVGVEALARWRHPREAILLPDAFIPMLEQTGLIRSLTPWVVNEALEQSQKLLAAGLPLMISVNLSVCDLQDPYLAEAFAEQLAAHQIAPASLEIEITESAVMTEPVRALDMVTRLADMGLRLAIDDFGTGYSSLSYLKKLPVKTIKIDKTFVLGMIGDENDAAIVRTSIELAHNLGLEVVAEGVENAETLQRLKELGCDQAQGNYLSRPLTRDELGVWLQQSTWGLRRLGVVPRKMPS